MGPTSLQLHSVELRWLWTSWQDVRKYFILLRKPTSCNITDSVIRYSIVAHHLNYPMFPLIERAQDNLHWLATAILSALHSDTIPHPWSKSKAIIISQKELYRPFCPLQTRLHGLNSLSLSFGPLTASRIPHGYVPPFFDIFPQETDSLTICAAFCFTGPSSYPAQSIPNRSILLTYVCTYECTSYVSLFLMHFSSSKLLFRVCRSSDHVYIFFVWSCEMARWLLLHCHCFVTASSVKSEML